MSAAFARRLGPTDRKKLIAGIHAQAHALRLDDDTRRDLQRQLVGVESTKDMSLSQLGTVWHRLTDLAKHTKKRPGRDERLPDEPATLEQQEKISELFAAINVHESGLRMRLCIRACGHPWAQTRAEANKIMEMLKAMAARGWRPKEAERDVEGSVLADRAVADSPDRRAQWNSPSSRQTGKKRKRKNDDEGTDRQLVHASSTDGSGDDQ